MNKPDSPVSEIKAGTKLNFKIDWNMALILSALAAFVSFFLGAVMKIRVLLFLSDIIIIGMIIIALIVAAVSIIKLFASPSNK